MRLDRNSEVILQKANRYQIKSAGLHEIVESKEAEVWVNILISIKKLICNK